MAEGGALDLEAQFARIRQQFVKGLPGRWQELTQATSPEERCAVLHRLAGAAGSFGFEALGQLAREAMAAIEAGDAVQQSACIARLEAAMQALCLASGPGDTIS